MTITTNTNEANWPSRQWQIGSITTSEPGSRTSGLIEHGSTADGATLQTPVHLLVGAEAGPVLYVQAAVHGDEVNGVEVLRRVVSSLNPKEMRGALIVVPVINGTGFVHHHRRNGFDMEDMNRVWPGKSNGQASAQIVYHLYQQAVRHAQYVIDLHTANSQTLLHVVYGHDDAGSRKMAEVFGIEILLEEAVNADLKAARFDGKLRNVLTSGGVAAITPELGGNNTFEEKHIELGVRGVTNVMKHLGMLAGEIVPPDRPQITLLGSHQDGVRATHGGLWHHKIQPGDRVKAGQVIGETYSIRTFEIVETQYAPADGFVLGIADVPIVNIGDRVANICRTE